MISRSTIDTKGGINVRLKCDEWIDYGLDSPKNPEICNQL